MTRLSDVKEQLLAARREAQDELNSLDKAIDAIGIQREQAPQKQRKAAPKRAASSADGNRRPTSTENIDRIMRVLRNSDRPLRSREVAEAADLTTERAVKALAWLKKQGEVRERGRVEGVRGKVALYEATTSGELGEALRPAAPAEEGSGEQARSFASSILPGS